MDAMTSDELGEIGESTFRNLCALAKLHCNKSERDRTGWDFIVESVPEAPTAKQSLDQRAAGLSCHVQVKATSTASDRISLRLSSAERLAKDPKPSFIIVLRLNAAGETLAGYLVHLLGPNLAKLLKRLRHEQAAGRNDINQVTLTYDYVRAGLRFPPTGAGLRAAIEKASGPDPKAYGARKRQELENLGYDEARFEIDAALDVQSPADLVDVLLGLRPALAHRIETFDTRFGVRLPLESFGPGVEILLSPEASAHATVTLHGPPLTTPAVFPAEVIAPGIAGPLSEADMKLLVRTQVFTLTLTSAALRFDTADDLDTRELPLRTWDTLFRGLSNLASGKGRINVAAGGDPEAFTIGAPTLVREGIIADLPRLIDATGALLRLIELAGLADDSPISYGAIIDATPGIELAATVTIRSSSALLAADFPTKWKSSEVIDAVFGNALPWADALIGYAATVRFRKQATPPGPWRSETITPLDVRVVTEESLDDYLRGQGQAVGLEIIRPQWLTEPSSSKAKSGA